MLPGAPTTLSAVAVSNSEIDLSWTAASGVVASYTVYRGTTSGGEPASPVATAITQTTYADKSLTQGQNYYYKVTAVNAAGEGPASNEATAQATQPAIALAIATGSSSSSTVKSGQPATYHLLPEFDHHYAGTITFACTGAPSGYKCAVPSPAAIVLITTSTPITITAKSTASASVRPSSALISFAAAFAILPLLYIRRNRWILFLVCLTAIAFLGPTSCGGNNGTGSTNPPPVTSTLTVTATAQGVASATQTLTLTVQ